MAKILIVAEHSGGKLNPSTAKSVTCASKIDGADIDVAVLAASAGDVASQAAAIKGVKKVSLHEPLTGLLRVTVVTVEAGTPRTEIWRALYGAAYFKGDCGKICIAVNEDIDVDSPDSILWAMAYRANPSADMQLLQRQEDLARFDLGTDAPEIRIARI